MTTGQRIIINTLTTYCRTLLAVFLGLFSSRWVLAALGDIDYGLMGVVGGVLVFITFFNALATAANARYFAFSIGQNDPQSTGRWFNCALSIAIILPTFLVIIGLIIGPLVITHFLSIPPDRLYTSLWVFRISLITALITMICAPFLAMFTAKQNIAELSFWGIFITITSFIFVYFLSDIPGNKWLIYTLGISSITSFFNIIQSIRAYVRYPECKIVFRYWFDKAKIKEMFSYSFWTLFGALGGLFYHNGIAIVLNKFFKPEIFPSVNASYTIGHTVAGHTQTISSSLSGAFMPEIVSSEGSGNRDRVIYLMFKSIRLSFIIISIVVLPILFQTEFILTAWLKHPPEYAALFCRTMLIAFLLMRLVGSFDSAICATGHIRAYQQIMLLIAVSTIVLSSLFLYLGYGLYSVCGIIVFYGNMFIIVSIYFCKKRVNISITQWIKDVVKPIIMTMLLNISIGFAISWITATLNPILRFLIVSSTIILTTSVINWFLLTDSNEKLQIQQIIHKLKLNKPISHP